MTRPIAARIDVASALRKLAVVLATAAFLAAAPGAARAQTPAGCGSSGQAPPPDADPHFLELVHYRCTFYDQDVANALANARGWLDWRAAFAPHPALVLDIDETSLTNWKQLYQNKFVFIATGPCSFSKGATCSQAAWERSASAPAIKPTRDLFNAAKAEGVAVFFITGRHDSAVERAATEKNLHRAGYDGWQHLFFRTKEFDGPSVAPFKTWARSQIAAHGYTVIASVGDQWSDLDGGYAERTFKVPNPFYFIP